MIRAVIDTNVLLSARRSGNLRSPNAEIIYRWTAGEFTWLVSTDVFEEYAGKLREFGLLTADTVELLARLMLSGERVERGCNSSSVNWFLAGQSKFFG